jgi:hypothetical protein
VLWQWGVGFPLWVMSPVNKGVRCWSDACDYGARKGIVSARTPSGVCGDAAYLIQSEAGPHTLFPNATPTGQAGRDKGACFEIRHSGQ